MAGAFGQRLPGPCAVFYSVFVAAVGLGLKKQGFLGSGTEKCLYYSVSCFIQVLVTCRAAAAVGEAGLRDTDKTSNFY